MATKTSASRRASGRGRSGSSRSGGGASSQQAVIIGAGAVVVILLMVFLMKGSGGAAAADPKPAAPAPAAQPKVAPPPVALPAAPASSSKKPLKPPLTPPPELTQAKLGELSQLLVKIKELHNAGVTARHGTDNAGARAKESEAKQLLEQWKASIQAQLDWQMQAEMEYWQQPAEYVALARIYGEWASLDKSVRMGGGG